MLQKLSLAANQLSALPQEIGQLMALQRLDLRANQLRALPPECGQLRSLLIAAELDNKPLKEGLWLTANLLSYPYPSLIAAGQPSATANVLAWLRGELDPATLSALPDTEQTPERNERPVPPPEIPKQGYGPHFEIGDDGVITFAAPDAFDRHGNNVARLKKLHPSLRTLSSELVEMLGKGNSPHWHLRDRADAYRALVDQDLERIDFSLLYVEGVRLANAERAALGEKDLPTLPPPVRETIDTLLQVHGTFILATIDGLEAIAVEERYRRTPHEEIEYRTTAVDLAQKLQNEPKVIDPKVASFVLGAAEEIGRGANPERSGTVATGTVKNAVITVSTAAALCALSAAAIASGSSALIVGAGATVLVVGEGLKKSKPFAAVAALVSKGLDKTSEAEIEKVLRNFSERLKPQLRFALMAEPQLRRLAGQRDEFSWVNRALDWIKQQAPDKG